MAQLVEHILGKDEVPGPNPGSSSRHPRDFISGLWLFIGEKRVRWTRFFIAQARGCLVLLLCAASGFVRQKRTQALNRTAFRLPHYTSPYRHGGQNRFATLAAYGTKPCQGNTTARTNNIPPPAASIRVSIFKLDSRNRGFGFL